MANQGDPSVETQGSLIKSAALDAAGAGGAGTESVHRAIARTNLVRTATRTRDVFLFIYRVRHAYDAYSWLDNIRYCTVFARGRHLQEAERIAINCVHQHGWRILRTDTATAFAMERFTDDGTDAAHVANLYDFGVSFRLNH